MAKTITIATIKILTIAALITFAKTIAMTIPK